MEQVREDVADDMVDPTVDLDGDFPGAEDDDPSPSSFSSSRVGICFLMSSESNELTPLDSLPTGDSGFFMLLRKLLLTGEMGDSKPNPSRRSPTPDIGTSMLRAIVDDDCPMFDRTDGVRLNPEFLPAACEGCRRPDLAWMEFPPVDVIFSGTRAIYTRPSQNILRTRLKNGNSEPSSYSSSTLSQPAATTDTNSRTYIFIFTHRNTLRLLT